MNILLINKFFYRKGGAETYFLSLIELLEKKGHKVFVFSMLDEKNEKSFCQKYFINHIDFSFSQNWKEKIKKSFHFIYSFEAKKKLITLLKENKIDIAHLHNISHQLTPSIIDVLAQNKIPMIQTLHDFQLICPNYKLFSHNKICEKCHSKKYYQCVLNKCVQNSYLASFLSALELTIYKIKKYEQKIKLFIAPSKFLKEKFTKWNFSAPIEQLYYFIDLKKYISQNSAGDYILYVGRLSEEKGLTTLIKAFKTGLPDLKLKIAGTGPMAEKLTSEINPSIEFLGYQNQEEIKNLISNSRFVIIPSEWYENNPLVILESMALGKPVIASELGGMAELIKSNYNGFLFPSQDYLRLKEIIIKLNNDPKLRETLGKNARKTAEKLFDQEKHYEKLLDIYQKVIKK